MATAKTKTKKTTKAKTAKKVETKTPSSVSYTHLTLPTTPYV